MVGEALRRPLNGYCKSRHPDPLEDELLFVALPDPLALYGHQSDLLKYPTMLVAVGSTVATGISSEISIVTVMIATIATIGQGIERGIPSRRVNEAVKVFDELENSNSKADIISCNSLINCLGKNGDHDEVHMRFKEM
ncbi:hypothetical protein RJ639_016351 [Escallonia herrerae]|uniref:Pentatricopeptide repeat-containing protein n=1 Tax=Escallonia herrerae TaxID=1293975 RepID=A0AA88VCK2_9ASTE|nr:hypothetical protein RJ639_016351 [Escallonia herrerae]